MGDWNVNETEARNEALRRWGGVGFAYWNGGPLVGGLWACVGRWRGKYAGKGGFDCINRPTFEACFADATAAGWE